MGRTGGIEGLTVGRYTRISDDTGSDAKGVARQEQDETAYIVAGGGTPGPVYEENDTSAYKKRRVRLADGTVVYRVVRPVWQRMLDDLRAGTIGAACVYDLDRLARDPRDLEDAIEVVEHHRRPIVGVTGGFDLMTDNGKFAARILVAQANKSSADTARRVARKHLELQQNGTPTGGTRPFGWLADKKTLHPTESAELRKAVGRVAAGVKLGDVVADWNARSIRTTRGNRWVYTVVREMLRNPRLCGYRARTVTEHNDATGTAHQYRQIVRNPDGTPVAGQWEPLISVAEWEALTQVIGDGRAGKADTVNARTYLLSGILRCGKCTGRMRGAAKQASKVNDTATFVYACRSTSLGGCGGIARAGEPTDHYVTEAILAKVELELADAVSEVSPWPRDQELADVTQTITEWTAGFKAKQLSAARYFAELPAMEAAERELIADRSRHRTAQAAASARPADIRAEWADYTLSQRRARIEDAVHAVIVHPAGRGRHAYNPDLLEPIWKD